VVADRTGRVLASCAQVGKDVYDDLLEAYIQAGRWDDCQVRGARRYQSVCFSMVIEARTRSTPLDGSRVGRGYCAVAQSLLAIIQPTPDPLPNTIFSRGALASLSGFQQGLLTLASDTFPTLGRT
jgi:hypothetical protein